MQRRSFLKAGAALAGHLLLAPGGSQQPGEALLPLAPTLPIKRFLKIFPIDNAAYVIGQDEDGRSYLLKVIYDGTTFVIDDRLMIPKGLLGSLSSVAVAPAQNVVVLGGATTGREPHAGLLILTMTGTVRAFHDLGGPASSVRQVRVVTDAASPPVVFALTSEGRLFIKENTLQEVAGPIPANFLSDTVFSQPDGSFLSFHATQKEVGVYLWRSYGFSRSIVRNIPGRGWICETEEQLAADWLLMVTALQSHRDKAGNIQTYVASKDPYTGLVVFVSQLQNGNLKLVPGAAGQGTPFQFKPDFDQGFRRYISPYPELEGFGFAEQDILFKEVIFDPQQQAVFTLISGQTQDLTHSFHYEISDLGRFDLKSGNQEIYLNEGYNTILPYFIKYGTDDPVGCHDLALLGDQVLVASDGLAGIWAVSAAGYSVAQGLSIFNVLASQGLASSDRLPVQLSLPLMARGRA